MTRESVMNVALRVAGLGLGVLIAAGLGAALAQIFPPIYFYNAFWPITAAALVFYLILARRQREANNAEARRKGDFH